MRVIGVDIGAKRVGVAMSDELGITAQPVKTIVRRSDEEFIEELKEIVQENKASEIVVGLPLNLNGTIGESAKKVISLVERLKEKTDCEVSTWDERLTSLQAEKLLIGLDRSRRKRKEVSDEMAAVLILQAYLDYRRKDIRDV